MLENPFTNKCLRRHYISLRIYLFYSHTLSIVILVFYANNFPFLFKNLIIIYTENFDIFLLQLNKKTLTRNIFFQLEK